MAGGKSVKTFWHLACGLGLPALAATLASVSGQGTAANAALGLSGGFLGAAGGIWQNLYAGRHQRNLDESERERDRLFNHDLAKAVALSIATILQPISESDELPAHERDALRILIQKSETVWLRFSDSPSLSFEPLLDWKLSETAVPKPGESVSRPHGTPKMWMEVLASMASACGSQVSDALPHSPQPCVALQRAVAACHAGFAQRFHDDLKHDFATKGQAFAAVHLRLMGELLVLARTHAETNTEIRSKIDALTEAVRSRGEEVVAWIGEDHAKGERRIARLRPLTSWLKSIDRKLASIERKTDDAILRLQKLKKQGVRTEQAVRDEGTKTRSQSRQESESTHKRLRPLLPAIGIVLVLSLVSAVVLTLMAHRTKASADRAADNGESVSREISELSDLLRSISDFNNIGLSTTLIEGESPIELVIRSIVEEGQITSWAWEQLGRTDIAILLNSTEDLGAIRSLGQSRFSGVHFDHDLHSVLQYIGAISGTTFARIDWTALEYQAIDKEVLVQLDFESASVTQILDALVAQLNDGFELLAWGVRDGEIVFATFDQLQDAELTALNSALRRPDQIADTLARYGWHYGPVESMIRDESLMYEMSKRHYLKALAINESLERYEQITEVNIELARLESFRGQYEAAAEFYSAALESTGKTFQDNKQIELLANLGHISQSLEKLDEALGYYRRALRESEVEEDIGGVCSTLNSIGFVEILRGNHDQAAKHLTRAEKAASRLDLRKELLSNRFNQIVLALRNDDHKRAWALHSLVLKSYRAAPEDPELRDYPFYYRAQGTRWKLRQDFDSARALWEMALELLAVLDNEEEAKTVQALIDLLPSP